MHGTVDFAFWIVFFAILLPSMAAGWWLRGEWEREKANEVKYARMHHPSYRVPAFEQPEMWGDDDG